MRPLANLKLDYLVLAALAGLGLASAASRSPAPARRRPSTPAGNLAALREELHADQRHRRTSAGGSDRGGDGRARGRDASSPTEIPARGWMDIGKRVAANVSRHRLMSEAAGVTFFGLLAMFPALAALISLYGMVADPSSVSDHINALNGVVPSGGMQIIGDQLKRITENSGGALSLGAIFGLLLALWSANGGTKSIFDSLNVVYEETEKRSFIYRTVLSLALTLGSLVFVIIALIAVVALPIALNFVGLGGVADVLLRLARWPVLLVIISLFLAVLYRYGPSRAEPRWRWVTWGGGFAAIVWVILSIAFSWYVANFGSYNKTYGSLGAVVGFMTWIWLSTIVVLVGAEIDAEMEHQTARDTTKGPEKPLGARGATKANEVAA